MGLACFASGKGAGAAACWCVGGRLAQHTIHRGFPCAQKTCPTGQPRLPQVPRAGWSQLSMTLLTVLWPGLSIITHIVTAPYRSCPAVWLELPITDPHCPSDPATYLLTTEPASTTETYQHVTILVSSKIQNVLSFVAASFVPCRHC